MLQRLCGWRATCRCSRSCACPGARLPAA